VRTAPHAGYLERGGSWRSFWSVAGVLAVLVGVDAALPGPDVPPGMWLLAAVLVLGCGWSLPEGRSGLPLRRTDGTTVLVPTRAPAQLTEAIRTAHPAGGVHTDEPGRVEP
jgi:hypothetical protein